MAALQEPPLISVEDYLNTAYDPDVEYVDGVLVERQMGDWLHALVQSNIIFALRTKYPHLKAVPELRSRVSATRFRLPDITVLTATPKSLYLDQPPLVAIEVLSEKDVASEVMEKLKEYARLGTPNIWLIDSRLQTMSIYRQPTLIEIEGDAITTADGLVQLSRAGIFAE